MASQPYTNWAQLSAAEMGCKRRLVLQNGCLETGSRKNIPNKPKAQSNSLQVPYVLARNRDGRWKRNRIEACKRQQRM